MLSAAIEALHIYDEHRNPILSHTYAGRPVLAQRLLPLYLVHPAPRPSLIYITETVPPTLVFSLLHANILFLATTTSEAEPLLVVEFLHRIVDAFEDFLGAPLLSAKIEASYDVVAQLLGEMCDAGLVSITEPNALHDLVEVEGWMGKLLGGLNLPSKPALGPSAAPSGPLALGSATALPWRRSSVRHTSNEMYADVVESLSVTLAPSGRPLAAFANGTIAFTSKISGVPDISLSLKTPSGRHDVASLMELPVFHPCVRLSRWKERPGELSFIPPDGRCVLAGYEVDLMPFSETGGGALLAANAVKLPVSLEIKTGLGPAGAEFEVRVHLNRVLGGAHNQSVSPHAGAGGGTRGGAGVGRAFSATGQGTPSSPVLDDVAVSVTLPAEVRNLPDIRPSKGDASYNPVERLLEWHIPAKALAAASSFTLRCIATGAAVEARSLDADMMGFASGLGYDEPYQAASPEKTPPALSDGGVRDDEDAGEKAKEARRTEQNRLLMPGSASVSFTVKGWLASGLKVESMVLNARKSRGVGEGVKPYKGVKYLTVSKGGVEIRC